MKKDEHHLQVQMVKYLDLCGYDFFAVPNGGLRNVRVAAQLKAEGVKAGVADLFICMPNANYHGLFIEVKVGRNVQQPSQKKFESIVRSHGYQYKIVKSMDELVALLDVYKKEKSIKRTYADGYKDGQLSAQTTKI